MFRRFLGPLLAAVVLASILLAEVGAQAEQRNYPYSGDGTYSHSVTLNAVKLLIKVDDTTDLDGIRTSVAQFFTDKGINMPIENVTVTVQ